MNLVIRLLINAVAIYAAAYFVNGVNLDGTWGQIAFVAIIFGVVNAIIKPIVKLFSLPFILLTLGLFTLVVNALMLWLTSNVSGALSVAGFGPAFWGAIVISLVSWVLSSVLTEEDDED